MFHRDPTILSCARHRTPRGSAVRKVTCKKSQVTVVRHCFLLGPELFSSSFPIERARFHRDPTILSCARHRTPRGSAVGKVTWKKSRSKVIRQGILWGPELFS